ncbi:MAG: hypothetical protein CMJ34_13255 [Phycisphaerae bacterium]|nr:hypothetical protein [Phycisphaerae bacterium]
MSILRSLRLAAMAAGVAAVFAGDVVVDTLADSNLLSNTAEAQGRGGRGGGWGGGMSGMREIRELLEPDFSRRDMPLFVEQLNLDDGQRAIVEALLDDYEDSFGTGSEMVQGDLTDLGRSMMQSFMGGGAMADMRERMGERMRDIRAELEEMEANGEELTGEERRDYFRERMQETSQDMMQDAMDTGAFDEARGVMTEMLDILEEWVAERTRLHDTFVADVEIQLDDDQMVLWPAFDRFLTREKSLPRGRLSGEDVNLFLMIDDSELSDATFDALAEMLDEYELALHQAIVTRDDYLLQSAPKLFKAMRDGDVDDAERVLKQQVRFREAVRDTNDRYREIFVETIADPEEKARLNGAILEEAYERIYRPTWAHRAFEAALEMDDLGEDTASAVMALQATFLAEMANRNRTLMIELRKSEGDEQIEQGTRMVSIMSGDFSGGMPWGGGRGGRGGRGGDEDDRYRDGMRERGESEERYVEQLMAMLTPEQQEALPERRGRGGERGGWGGGDNDERRQEMIRRFDTDGDGELNEDERRQMFESFRNGGGRGGEEGRGGRGGRGGGEAGGRGGRGGEGGGRGGRGGQGGRGGRGEV